MTLGMGTGLVPVMWCVLLGYIALSATQLYYLWYPVACSAADISTRSFKCIHPRLPEGSLVDVRVFAVDTSKPWPSAAQLAFEQLDVDPHQGFQANFELPAEKYGSREYGAKDLYGHVYFYSQPTAPPSGAPMGRDGTFSKSGVTRQDTREVINYLIVPLTRALPYRYHGISRNLLQQPEGGAAKGANSSLDDAAGGSDPQVDSGDADTHPTALDTQVCNEDADVTDGTDGVCTETPPAVEDRVLQTEEEEEVGRALEKETQEWTPPPEAHQFVRGHYYSHIRPSIEMRMVDAHPYLRQHGLLQDLQKLFKRSIHGNFVYGPLVELDETRLLKRHWRLLSTDTDRPDPTIQINVAPMSLGSFRLMSQFEMTYKHMQTLGGLAESDLEDIKELFVELGGSWKMWIMTTVIGLLHSIFAFLAFKNDVGFWKARTSLEGLSVRTFFSSLICQFIILLKLMDIPNVSNIIRVEVAVGVVIEGWKVFKIAKRRGMLRLEHWIKKKEDREFQIAMSKMEEDTDRHDAYAMKILGMVLYPIVIVWAIYSLMYHNHRSWWSWVVASLANGVYMFGFIAMTPQLYINYRLKSVAHLPWRCFMYKAFNTFVDDAFAFAIVMPMSHRIACLRDDVVFFVYLYQRWLYPVDKTRANEFGRAYELSEEEKATKAADDAASILALDCASVNNLALEGSALESLKEEDLIKSTSTSTSTSTSDLQGLIKLTSLPAGEGMERVKEDDAVLLKATSLPEGGKPVFDRPSFSEESLRRRKLGRGDSANTKDAREMRKAAADAIACASASARDDSAERK